jgi:hypothetical protein
MRIRDQGFGMEKFGSGMEKVGSGINIPDLQQTLRFLVSKQGYILNFLVKPEVLVQYLAVLRIRTRRIRMFLGLPDPLIRDTDPIPLS